MAYIEAHPEAKEFQHKTLPMFDELDAIFTGKVAVGDLATSSFMVPGDPNHGLIVNKHTSLDLIDEGDHVSSERKASKILKRNPLHEVARSLDNLASSVVIDTRQPIKDALLLFDENYAHSYNVSSALLAFKPKHMRLI